MKKLYFIIISKIADTTMDTFIYTHFNNEEDAVNEMYKLFNRALNRHKDTVLSTKITVTEYTKQAVVVLKNGHRVVYSVDDSVFWG